MFLQGILAILRIENNCVEKNVAKVHGIGFSLCDAVKKESLQTGIPFGRYGLKKFKIKSERNSNLNLQKFAMMGSLVRAIRDETLAADFISFRSTVKKLWPSKYLKQN